VGQIPVFLELQNNILLAIYRFRRCFPPGGNGEDALDYLGSYTKPIDTSKLYSVGELHRLCRIGISGKGFITSRVLFRTVFSNKATMECTGKMGGFNRTVKLLSSFSGENMFLPTVLEDPFDDATPRYFARVAHRDKTIFSKAVSGAIFIMRNLKRPPYAFCSILNERSLKMRIPTLAEGFCQVLSQHVSDIGKEIQRRLFPLTSGTGVKMRHRPGDLYLSGDYAESTNFIWWEAIRVGYFHLFKNANLTTDEFNTYMEIICLLAGPHLLYSDRNERKRYIHLFSFSTKFIGKKLGFDTIAYYMKNGISGPIVGTPVATGSRFGTLGEDFSQPPGFNTILESLKEFRVSTRTLLTVRGVLMAYSIAAPALHVVGAIPHWKFRELRFAITGDDNGSAHNKTKRGTAIESLNELEQEKSKTGMVVHDSQKAARGPLGMLVAERFYYVRAGFDNLVELNNFPVRILFPEDDNPWHAITMPDAVLQNLNEVDCDDIRDRVVSFVYWKYEKIYAEMSQLRISIGGPQGLFKTLPETPGCINSSGGYLASEIFKLPSQVGFSYPIEIALALLSEKITIPWEDVDNESSYKGTTERFLSLDDLLNFLRPFTPESPYDSPVISGSAPPVMEVIRKNIRNLESRREVSRECINIPPPLSPYPSFFTEKVMRQPFGDIKDIEEQERVADLLSDIPEPPYRAAIGYYTTSFRSVFPTGISIEFLATLSSVWFIDCANTFPKKFREKNGVFPLGDYILECGSPTLEGGSIFFVIERPGRTVMIEDFDTFYIRACPRQVGHAGADNEFRSLLTIFRRYNPEIEIFFTSKDLDWKYAAACSQAAFRRL